MSPDARPAVSVIVTSYNIEKYIGECLEGVVAQTLPNLEIIVVDDGSTDGTVPIIERFAARDSRIVPILLPTNSPGGVATAANAGLDRATGTYVGFVDGDDLVEPTMFEKLLTAATSHDADLAMCRYLLLDESTRTYGKPADDDRWARLSQPSYLLDNPTRKRFLPFVAVPWRKLYRRDLLERNHIRFPVGDYFYEDNPFHWFCLLSATSLAVVPEVLCYHRVARTGQTMNTTDRRLLRMFDHQRTIQAWVDHHGLASEFSPNVVGWVISQGMWVSRQIVPGLRRELFSVLSDIVGRYDPRVIERMFRDIHRGPYAIAFTRSLEEHNYATFVRLVERGLDSTPAVSALYHLRYSGPRATARVARSYAAHRWTRLRDRRVPNEAVPPPTAVTSEDLTYAVMVLDAKIRRLTDTVSTLVPAVPIGQDARAVQHPEASRVLLVVLTDGPLPPETLDDIDDLVAMGARAVLASGSVPARIPVGVARADVLDLSSAARTHGPAFRRALHSTGLRDRLTVLVRNDPWMKRWAQQPGVIVGLGTAAARAAEEFSSLHPLVRVAADTRSARRMLEHGLDRPHDDPPPSTFEPDTSGPNRLVEAATPLTSEKSMTQARQAVVEAISAVAQGDEAAARSVVAESLGRVADERLRADVWGDVSSWALHHGLAPSLVYDAYEAELAMADVYLRDGDLAAAGSSYMEALRGAFSPVVHMQQTSSPMATDPGAFMAPLQACAVAQRLRGSVTSSETEPVVSGRRLLFAAHNDPSFLRPVLKHFAAMPGIETRFKTFQGSTAVERYGKRQALLVREVLSGGGGLTAALEESFRDHVDDVDVVFVEWSTVLAALLSHMPHPGVRLVVRMHSWEVFSYWPHLINFANVDDLVFVSEPVRDFAAKVLPGLADGHRPRLHVLPNAMSLGRFRRQKDDDARFTIGVVGASRVVKDPLWAVEVIRRLHEMDERYRLRLIRGHLDDESPAGSRYASRLEAAIDALPEGVVEITEHTDNLPEALADVGVVLSSSVRESFHIGLVEGVASGALPVVRDWPYFAGAAARIFPAEWVVSSPAEAAERVITHTSDPRVWRQACEASTSHVMQNWDWSVVHPLYEQLLLAG